MPLLDQIRATLKRDNVTFAELHEIDGFSGEFEICINIDTVANIILWSGMSQEAVDAIETIRQEGEYDLVPTPILTYLIDGRCLSYPLAKSRRRYKKPHWLPCVFRHKHSQSR